MPILQNLENNNLNAANLNWVQSSLLIETDIDRNCFLKVLENQRKSNKTSCVLTVTIIFDFVGSLCDPEIIATNF